MHLLFELQGKTYTLMSPDGVAATIIEKSFRKMAANENLQYKVSQSFYSE